MKNTNENLNRIAAKAASLSRGQATKKDAFAIVRTIITDPHLIDDSDLAVLYKQFMPAVPAKPKTPEQWVALAMGKKDVRHYLNWIYSDGTRIVATDGWRLHLYVTDKYPAGFYDKTMQKCHDTDYTHYPDFDQVIPKDYDQHAKIDAFELIDYAIGRKPVGAYKLDDLHINKQFMDGCLLGFTDPDIYYRDKLSTVYIKDGDRVAVCMPFRADKVKR